MDKKDLLKEKQALLDDINTKRAKLMDINKSINAIGGSVSFINLVLIPLVVAAIVTALTYFMGFNDSQNIGAFVITFIIAMAFSTYLNRKKIFTRKEELKKERLSLQTELVSMGKRLAEIEKGLK